MRSHTPLNMRYLVMPLMLLCLTARQQSSVEAQNPAPTTTYANTQILQSPDLFYLYWSYTNTDITFEVHVKDAAWLLFGVKGATYSNVVVGALFPDTTGHYSERILFNNNNTLVTNPDLAWYLLDAFKSNNYTILKFQRNLKVQCDQTPSTPSLDISTGESTIVFATGDTFNEADASISVANLQSTQINLLPTLSANTQFPCVTPALRAPFNSVPTAYYTSWVDLVPDIYRVYWNVSDTNLTAEIHVKTNGWVGFGFSPNGGMAGSNVVIGYIASDGSVSFTDRYIRSATAAGVALTKNQSVQLLAYGSVNDYVYFKFTRLIKICDSEHISISVSKLIFCYFCCCF